MPPDEPTTVTAPTVHPVSERTAATAPLAYVGARIRAARLDAGLTQAELAKSVRISRPQVANIEAGVTDTPLRVFVAILRALRLDPSAVLREPTCAICGDQPPGGFTCNACGAGREVEVTDAAG